MLSGWAGAMETPFNIGLVDVLRLQADRRRLHTKRTVQLEAADGVTEHENVESVLAYSLYK